LDGFSWIAGEWRASAASKTAESINPATGESIGHFDDADEPSVRAAIAAASAAFYRNDWSSAPRLRASVLLQFADLLDAERTQIAERCCQSDANSSPLGAAIASNRMAQAASDCHSASAAERRSL
jgi:acyl-CoA reductase-like NAD-dependent aldehyde dehydrogenase